MKKKGWGFGKRPGVDVCTIKKDRLKITALSNQYYLCSDTEKKMLQVNVRHHVF